MNRDKNMCIIHKYIVQINIMFIAFLKNLSYNKDINL